MLRVKIMRMVASLGVQTDFLAVLAQPRQCNSRMAKALAYSGHYLKAHIDQSYGYEQSSEGYNTDFNIHPFYKHYHAFFFF